MWRGCEGKGQLGASRWEVGEGGRAGAAACITAAWHGLIGSIGGRRRQHPSCCYITKRNVSNLHQILLCHLNALLKLKAAQPFEGTAWYVLLHFVPHKLPFVWLCSAVQLAVMQANEFASKAFLQAIKGKGWSSQDIWTCCHDCQTDRSSLAMTAGIPQGKCQLCQQARQSLQQQSLPQQRRCSGAASNDVSLPHLRRDCR